MAAIVDIDSRSGLRIEMCHRNQPNKSKVVLYIQTFTLTISKIIGLDYR